MFFKLKPSLASRGFPYVCDTNIPYHCDEICSHCEKQSHPDFSANHLRFWQSLKSIEVCVEASRKAVQYPDILLNGVEITVSKRVLQVWEMEGIAPPPSIPVKILPPLPKGLENVEPPVYYLLKTWEMVGAEIDYQKSSFLNAEVCPRCNRFGFDYWGSDKLRHKQFCPFEFKKGSWNGTNLFSALHFPGMFFCTESVIDCAHKYKLTNFYFTPIEFVNDSDYDKRIDYKKKSWRKQVSDIMMEYHEKLT